MGKTLFDILADTCFKGALTALIRTGSPSGYVIPNHIPSLYKYSGITHFSVGNLEQGQFTLSRISTFNDFFDAAVHTPVDKDAGKCEFLKMSKMYSDQMKKPFPDEFDSIADTIQKSKEGAARIRFSSLSSFLSVMVSSMSTDCHSTLMWAHYANSNQGICIEYDFDKLSAGHIYRDCIFPVAYIPKPLDLTPYNDIANKICEYPAEVATYAAAICKAECWKYEQEWRFVWVNLLDSAQKQNYLSMKTNVKASKIILGYHWLKPFYRNETFKTHYELVIRLFDAAKSQNISVFMMLPTIGSFEQKKVQMDIDELKRFVIERFDDRRAEDERYYNTCLDQLLDNLMPHFQAF